MYVVSGDDYFFIYVNKDEITVQWSLLGSPDSYRFGKENPNGDWNVLVFKMKDMVFQGGFKENVEDDNSNINVNDFNTTAFNDLFVKGIFYLGGSKRNSFKFLRLHNQYTKYNNSSYITNNSVTETNTVDLPIPIELSATDEAVPDKFKGCLGEIRIGELLLPFFTTSEIYSNNYTANEYFSLVPNSDHSVGCQVCFDEDCLNHGRCLNSEESYQCNCAPGYTAEDCSIDIDECLENQCKNNATCVDGIANFTCVCISGYEGWL